MSNENSSEPVPVSPSNAAFYHQLARDVERQLPPPGEASTSVELVKQREAQAHELRVLYTKAGFAVDDDYRKARLKLDEKAFDLTVARTPTSPGGGVLAGFRELGEAVKPWVPVLVAIGSALAWRALRSGGPPSVRWPRYARRQSKRRHAVYVKPRTKRCSRWGTVRPRRRSARRFRAVNRK